MGPGRLNHQASGARFVSATCLRQGLIIKISLNRIFFVTLRHILLPLPSSNVEDKNGRETPDQIMTDLNNFTIGISKKELGELPAAHFDGAIKVIDRPEDVAEAVAELRHAGIVGFDTETRPSFQKGQLHTVALLQLSTATCCYLFRINMLGLQDEIRDFLEDEGVMKIGLSTHDDFHNLNRIAKIVPRGFFELQHYVSQFRIEDKSLSKIYAILFGERISKGQRLTNWEAPELSIHQQAYAALDAFACLKIYRFLKEGKFKPDQSTYKKYPLGA